MLTWRSGPGNGPIGCRRHEIAEIEAATAGVLRAATSRQSHGPTSRLPTLGQALDRLRDEVLNGRGFVLIRGLPVDGPADRRKRRRPIGASVRISATRDRRMRRGTCSAMCATWGCRRKIPNVRIYQTTERQNFHTDSCDIVSLLCLKTAKSGGLSSLTSSMSVYNAMAARHPDLVWRLFQPMPPTGAARCPRAGALVRHADLQ